MPEGHLLLQTLRSHDQLDTTIYGHDDRRDRDGHRTLMVAISEVGKVFTGPLKRWGHSESAFNLSPPDTQTQTWGSITAIWSHIGNDEIIFGASRCSPSR